MAACIGPNKLKVLISQIRRRAHGSPCYILRALLTENGPPKELNGPLKLRPKFCLKHKKVNPRKLKPIELSDQLWTCWMLTKKINPENSKTHSYYF